MTLTSLSLPHLCSRSMALADVFVPALQVLPNEEALWVATQPPPPPPPPSPEPQIRELDEDSLEFCRLPSPLRVHHLHMEENTPQYPETSFAPQYGSPGDLTSSQYSVHQQLCPTSPLSSSPHTTNSRDAVYAMETSLQGSSSVENSLVLSYPSATSSSSTNLDLVSSGYEEFCEGKSLQVDLVPQQQRRRKVSMKRKNTDDFGGMDSGLEASQESSTGVGGGGGGDAEWVVIDVQPSHPIAFKKACPEAPQMGGNRFRHMLASASSHWVRASAHSDHASSSLLAPRRGTNECMQMDCEYRTESMDPATTMDVDDTVRNDWSSVTETYPLRNDVVPHASGWSLGSGMRSLAPPRDQPRCHSSGEMYVTGGGAPIVNGFLYHEHLTSSSISTMFQAHFSKSL